MTKQVSKLDELQLILKEVIEQLKDIEGITLNQHQILLSDMTQDEKLKILEEMANYKNEMTLKIEAEEDKFQDLYKEVRPQLTSKSYVAELQSKIKELLDLKDVIIKMETTSVEIMDKQVKNVLGKLNIPMNSNQALSQYKKFEKN
ncbi:MAG: hypothetical protein ATN36_01350 [Epulopiscium sp. Nele67-Bin005]|nr:MAG: hypothetical protein ATN36_01350 [Epulopiscium sp. Nele67-Bin005]